MNSLSNIWNHPKTSAAGLLIAIVTVAGVLSQQGVTLGNAGTGTIVTLAAAVATALLGLLAKDPSEAPSAAGSTAKLGAWALIALLLPVPFVAGCSPANAAQAIVNWTPALQSVVAVADSAGAVLDPAAGLLFVAATSTFDTLSNALVTQAKAYLANPTASVLAQLQTQVVTFQQQVNAALLAVAKIGNPASQQKATADVNAVGTVVNAILALVISISSKAAVAQMASDAQIKLAVVDSKNYRRTAACITAAHWEIGRYEAAAAVQATDRDLRMAGF
jgi:hypothetical protein